VKQTAVALFEQVQGSWSLDPQQLKPLLAWAAMLHEIGLIINFSAVQKHSSYIVQNSDLPGFNQEEQQALSTLIRFHRKAIKAYEFSSISNYNDQSLWRIIRLLRIAVALNHRRLDDMTPDLAVQVSGEDMNLLIPRAWAKKNKLLIQNLEREQKYLKTMQWGLTLDLDY